MTVGMELDLELIRQKLEVVKSEHRDLDETSLLLRLVGPRVRFNCARNAMVIDGATLNKVNPSSNLRLYTLMRELAERLLSEQQASTDIVQRISSEIEVRLPGGAFDLESIAKAMGLTQRSVRTRLATSETSFSTILDQTRQRLATEWHCFASDAERVPRCRP